MYARAGAGAGADSWPGVLLVAGPGLAPRRLSHPSVRMHSPTDPLESFFVQNIYESETISNRSNLPPALSHFSHAGVLRKRNLILLVLLLDFGR